MTKSTLTLDTKNILNPFKQGNIVISDSNMTILVTKTSNNQECISFAGVVLHSAKTPTNIGQYSEVLDKDSFKLYKGEITLSND